MNIMNEFHFIAQMHCKMVCHGWPAGSSCYLKAWAELQKLIKHDAANLKTL